MKVIINEDEVSAKDSQGNDYKINGILIKKPDEREVFHSIDTSFCKVVIYKGHEVVAINKGDGTIDIY